MTPQEQFLRVAISKLADEWDMRHGLGADIPDAACQMRRRLLGWIDNGDGADAA